MGVRYGINQRAAQEVLGHSDANLTAKAYTDVPALALHDEIAKLPWITDAETVAQHGAQNTGVSRPSTSLADIMSQFNEAVKVTEAGELRGLLASPVTPLHQFKLAARVGIEPTTK